MTTCNHHTVCSHLSPRLRIFSQTHGYVVELVAAPLLEGLQTGYLDVQDFAVVEAYDGNWLDAVDLDDRNAGRLLFIKGSISYGTDVEAYFHERDSNQDEVYEGDRVQWLVELDDFEVFTHRIAEVVALI
ncbi:hypothetical protein [Leifsonia sp. 2MCAF36]|uniref:hypothetical protein n=1 Tax=Leifsonia sp. 2MCAF36 TaxID=3232988 RepID=UPI003F9B90DF